MPFLHPRAHALLLCVLPPHGIWTILFHFKQNKSRTKKPPSTHVVFSKYFSTSFVTTNLKKFSEFPVSIISRYIHSSSYNNAGSQPPALPPRPHGLVLTTPFPWELVCPAASSGFMYVQPSPGESLSLVPFLAENILVVSSCFSGCFL